MFCGVEIAPLDSHVAVLPRPFCSLCHKMPEEEAVVRQAERSVKAARRGELGVMVYIMVYSDNSENKDMSAGK